MNHPVLVDKDQFPTEEVIFSHIGKSKALWVLLFDQVHRDHPDFTEQWRYYLDGKSWLLKVSRKEKTIFWVGVGEGFFRTTFYFTDRAEPLISESSLSDELKRQFKEGKNKLRGITVTYKNKKDVGYARELIDLKSQFR